MKSKLEIPMLKPAILALIRQILTIAGTALAAKAMSKPQTSNRSSACC